MCICACVCVSRGFPSPLLSAYSWLTLPTSPTNISRKKMRARGRARANRRHIIRKRVDFTGARGPSCRLPIVPRTHVILSCQLRQYKIRPSTRIPLAYIISSTLEHSNTFNQMSYLIFDKYIFGSTQKKRQIVISLLTFLCVRHALLTFIIPAA